MPDSSFNNFDNDSKNMPGSNENKEMLYENITAYIDNQSLSDSEKENIKKLIDTDSNFYNRYVFEKAAKEALRQRSKRIETAPYVYKNIGQAITSYGDKISASKHASNQVPDILSTQLNTQKSNLRKYLFYSSFAFVILIAFAFLLNYYINKNPELLENDIVTVSRNIYDKVATGQIKPQHRSDNAKVLADSMDKYLDFKVFIPDVKDAVLIGGVCNEINGEKLAHIIHKKGNIYIYTLQASKKEVMTNVDKIILCDKYKDSINDGKNWFPCLKDQHKTVVVWFKDNVICSTVADMEPQDIANTLTNYK